MEWSEDGRKVPTCIFEAACWHYAVRPVCACGHASTFNPHGLWWHFERRGWDDRLAVARVRFWCRWCQSRDRRKVTPRVLEVVGESDTDVILPWPDERVWKQALSRFRA